MPILFPVLPILLVPIVVCSLYFFFKDMPQKWGSWQNCCAALSFLMLNHYQMDWTRGAEDLEAMLAQALMPTLRGPPVVPRCKACGMRGRMP